MQIIKTQLSVLIVTVGFAIGAQAQPFLTNGLVAYYPFNGNANDESGNGNNAAVNSATLADDRFVVPAHSYSFNGSNSFLIAASGPSLNLVGSATFTFWMYWKGDNSDLTGNSQTIIDKSTPGNIENYRIAIEESVAAIPYKLSVLSAGAEVHASSVMEKFRWYHVAVVFSNGMVNIFLNGAVDVTAPLTLTATNANDLLLGTDHSPPGGRTFYGSLDEVRIYNRPLSPAEISAD